MSLNHLNPEQIARALALTGGGIRGLFVASALVELEAQSNRQLSFDVFAGTSVGGLIAMALAAEVPIVSIFKALKTNASTIFGKPAKWNPMGLRVSKHRPDGLRKVIQDVLGEKANCKIRSLTNNVVITSVNVTKGEITYFSNVPRIGATICSDGTLLDIAMATTAAPTYFPPHKIGNDFFVDGGLASNNPDLEAIRFCSNFLSRDLARIRLLSFATGTAPSIFSYANECDGGGLSWIVKHRLIDRLLSIQEDKATNISSDVLQNRYHRIGFLLDRQIPLDSYDAEVLDILTRQGQFAARSFYDGNPSAALSFLR